MDDSFFEQPILNSPYAYPSRPWELDPAGPADRQDHRIPTACRIHHPDPELAYVKNHNLGLEVPYRYGPELRTYIPDFIVLVDDGRGPEDPSASSSRSRATSEKTPRRRRPPWRPTRSPE